MVRQRGTREPFPSLMPKGPPIPVEIGRTTRRRHITGTAALNIPQRHRMSSGDWHEHATWFWHEPETLREGSLTNEATHGRLLYVLGLWGLRDARWGLAELGHPAGRRREPVWVATHDRAVVEAGWSSVVNQAPVGVDHPPFDIWELLRLLAYPDQWVRLHWWAWRLRAVMSASERELWDRWRRAWWPLEELRAGWRSGP